MSLAQKVITRVHQHRKASSAMSSHLCSGSVKMSTKPSAPVTRIIRFVSDDSNTYFGEAPSSGNTATVLSGSIFEPSKLVRTGQTKTIKKLLSPIDPPNIFCIGLNYMKHYEESAKKRGIPLPDLPVIFMKPTTCLTHPEEDIWLPQLKKGEQLDWEVELTIVIGKECRNVPASKALDYVLGYTVGNDVSSRHWQKEAGASQWIKGKSFDRHCPLGPVLVTAEAIPDPQALRVKTRVNGVTMQDETTRDMIFSCAQIIEWLSNNMTLLPGTVILTGTPSGVGTGKTPPVWLKEGDVVECEVTEIGVLKNTVRLPPPTPKL